MRLLPVVERELRVAARQRRTFYGRMVAAAVAIAFAAWTYWFLAEWQAAASAGKDLFEGLAALACLVCLLAGPLQTADALCREQREGTLGLLFLTDLRGLDIVLGKLAGYSINATLQIAAVLPVLALPILMGGVSLGQFGVTAVVLLNTLFLSLSAGLVMSAFSRQTRSAAALAILLLFLLGAAFPWFAELAGPNAVDRGLRAFSITDEFSLAVSGRYARATSEFWISASITHGLAWLCLGLAARHLASAYHEAPQAAWVVAWRRRWQEWSFGDARQRRELRRELLDRNPLIWLANRNRLRSRALWGLVGLAAFVWLVGEWWVSADWRGWGNTVVFCYFLQMPFKWFVASEAAQRWADDRRQGTLELLLTSGATVRDILSGHLGGIRHAFTGPVLALLVGQVVMLLLGIGRPGDWSALFVALATSVVFVWDLHALAWEGTLQGLLKPGPGRAYLATLTRVLVWPWLILIGLVFLGGGLVFAILPWLWMGVSGCLNLYFWQTASRRLETGLRLLVAETPESRRASGG
jgi:ABC-type Na+ efflux pump permease subunit